MNNWDKAASEVFGVKITGYRLVIQPVEVNGQIHERSFYRYTHESKIYTLPSNSFQAIKILRLKQVLDGEEVSSPDAPVMEQQSFLDYMAYTISACHENSVDFLAEFCPEADDLVDIFLGSIRSMIVVLQDGENKRVFHSADKITEWAEQFRDGSPDTIQSEIFRNFSGSD